MASSNTTAPLHIAIIPDGNRRWAKRHMLSPWKGHEQSAENFRAIADWCRSDPHVGVLTIWCFSTENWKRDPAEVKQLMKLLEKGLTNERASFQKNQTRIFFSGRKDRLSPSLKKLMDDIAEETAHFTAFTTNLALDYGGQDELLRAINAIDRNKEVTDETLRQCLDHPELPDIDLVIRTSGEQRTSNFALWQTTYAEWIFHPKLFPEFTTDDLATCIDAFEKRPRRFGA